MKNYKTVYEFNNEYYSRPENKMQRFIDAQNTNAGTVTVFQQAAEELKKGCKVGHWMWFVFPQLRGLGGSSTSYFYGLDNLPDANRFLQNDETNWDLCGRLIKYFRIILELEVSDPVSVFGRTDARKLFSCATLFSHTSSDFDKTACDLAREILQKYFDGKEDTRTLELMNYINVNELAVYLRSLIDPFDDFSRGNFSRRFPMIYVPRLFIEPTDENLLASEDFYINKAIGLCNENNIGYFRR